MGVTFSDTITRKPSSVRDRVKSGRSSSDGGWCVLLARSASYVYGSLDLTQSLTTFLLAGTIRSTTLTHCRPRHLRDSTDRPRHKSVAI